MELARKLFRNFLLLFFGNVVGQVLLLLGMVQLARVVGPAAFGAWSYAQAWFFYVLRAGEFGLEVTGIRAIARDRNELNQRVSWVLTLRLVLATVLFGGVVFLSALGVVPRAASSLVVLFSLGAFPVAISLEWLYEAVQKTRNVGVVRILKGLVFFLLVMLAVHGPDDLERAAIYYTLSLLIPAAVLLIIARREFGLRKLGVPWESAKELLKEAWPIAAATLCSQYSLFFSTIYLGYVAAESEVGYFSAAHRLVIFVWAYGIVASNRVLLPTLSSYFQESEEKYFEFIRTVTRVLAIAALPIAVIGSVAARDVIDLLYGADYSSSAIVFQVLVWALAIAVTRSGLEIGLIATQQQHLYLRGMLMTAALHTVLAPVGFALKGIAGVGIGMVIAESCYAVYLVYISRSSQILQASLGMWKIPVAAAVTLAGLLAFPMPMVFSIPAGVALYGGSLLVLGELSASDRVVLRQLIGW